MTVSVETYLRRGKRQLEGLLAVDAVRWTCSMLKHWAGGFILSAAALALAEQPLAMGLCCAQKGWGLIASALGAMLGYRVFWGSGQGMLWSAMGLAIGLLCGGDRTLSQPRFRGALAACAVAIDKEYHCIMEYILSREGEA